MAHINDLYSTGESLIPWISFLVGLSGSLHCVGMCGGLVMATTSNLKQNFLYQFGRLLGYLFVGSIVSSFGHIILGQNKEKEIALFVSILMGLTFIYMGLKRYFKFRVFEKAKLKIFGHVQRVLSKLAIRQRKTKNKSIIFYMGLFSIFLPCGFLYGFALVLSSFQNPILGAISMGSFWLGTIPALVLAPEIINKFLRPLFHGRAWLSSGLLVGLGLITIVYRLNLDVSLGSCH